MNEKNIKKYFPELKWISSNELREKVVNVWIEAMRRGKWENLEDAPFTLSFDDSGMLIDHSRRVTHLSKKVAEEREEKLDMDYLIAGALLHDVGKLLEYKKDGERITISDYGRKIRHPLSGAKLAEELNLPKEVVHIIASHSKEGDKMKRSKESIIVHHCDFIDFELIKEEKS